MLVSAFYTVAGIRWQNDWDRDLNVQCSNRQAIYGVQSYHSNHHEDRRWNFKCKNVVPRYSHCYWTGYENNWDKPIHFRCAANSVMAGVSSYHHNHYEDRRWRFKCCSTSGYKTKNCRLTGYINKWDAPMNYHTHSVFVGAFSYHSNYRE